MCKSINTRPLSEALYVKHIMKKVFELEVWSRPKVSLSADHGKELKTKIDSDLLLKEDLFLGLSFVPSETDTTNLLHALNENELKIGEFESFCKSNNLQPSVNNFISSAKFLEFNYGRALAWLHIPHSKEGLISLNKIIRWVSAKGYNVQCPQQLYCLLNNSKEAPLNW